MALKARIEAGIVYSPYPSFEIPECSAYACIKLKLQQYEERTAAIDGDVEMTHGQLLKRIQRYAAGFQAHGIKRRDHICVHLGNKLENLVAVFAIIAAGGTVVCARPTLTTRELLYQIRDSDAAYVLTDAANSAKVADVNSQHKLKGLFSVDDLPGFVHVHKFRDFSETLFQEVEIEDSKEEVMGLTYTSGTTGLPKAVQITHHGFVAGVTNGYCTPKTEKDVYLAWAPITHVSGFIYTMVHMCMGSTVVISEPRISFQKFVEVVRHHKVVLLFFFPTMLNVYVGMMEKTGIRLPSVRKVVVGGSTLSPAAAERALKVFDVSSFVNMYALSESCGVLCSPPPGQIAYDTIGYPGPGVQAKIVDASTGQALGPGQRGEMVVKPPGVMKGYYKRAEDTASVLSKDGWLRTGDCMYYDEHGKFYFLERLKEMIKCMDNQLAPAELEEILTTHPHVAEAAVVGIPHPKYGEAPTAFIVRKPAEDISDAVIRNELTQHVARQCAVYKHLYGGVHFVPSIPKTENGKVQRGALRWKSQCSSTGSQPTAS